MNRDDWLATVTEDILEPDIAICDAHHHLWDHPSDKPGSRYMREELLADTSSGHNVVSTVFVECMSGYADGGPEHMRPVGETEFVASLAGKENGTTDVAAGIVSFADLTLGERAGDVLEAHMAASPRFRGIRHAAGWDASDDIRNSHTDPPEGLLADDAFRRGFAELAPRGLTFDAWLYHPQIPELTSLARAFPETTIVLDHFGGPLGIGPYEGRRQEILEHWKPVIADLAACSNVVAKLGGLVMPINGYGFHQRERPPASGELADATRDVYLHTIDAFSPQRCMFESNFPVDRQSTSYAVLWNSFKRIAAGFDGAEKAALFHDTAVEAYRLTPD